MKLKELFKDKKNLLIIALIFIIAALTTIIVLVKINDQEQERINLFDITARKNDNFVFLGDSIFEYYQLDAFFGDLPVINSGISGNTTTDILSELKERVFIYNPTKVFLLIGTNDIQSEYTDEDILSNIEEIIFLINEHRPYAKIYLLSILPINDTDEIEEEMTGRRDNDHIRSLNEKIKELCDEECTFIDLFDDFTDESGNLVSGYTTDGLHLSTLGYIRMTRNLFRYFH